jgi:hypothetical protein
MAGIAGLSFSKGKMIQKLLAQLCHPSAFTMHLKQTGLHKSLFDALLELSLNQTRVQLQVAATAATASSVDGSFFEIVNTALKGMWQLNLVQLCDPKEKSMACQLQKGDRVRITKEGSQLGKMAVVSKDNWSGLVRVIMDGDCTEKAYQKSEVAKLTVQKNSAQRCLFMIDSLVGPVGRW